MIEFVAAQVLCPEIIENDWKESLEPWYSVPYGHSLSLNTPKVVTILIPDLMRFIRRN